LGLGRLLSLAGSGFLGIIFKIFIVLILITFILAGVVFFFIYAAFTFPMLIGIWLSETFYKRLNRRYDLRLPKYFYISFLDFLETFKTGEEDIDILREELSIKQLKAKKEVAEMREALQSIDEQLSQIKTKRNLKTLFKPSVADISPRTAKALEIELGKPRWSTYLDKTNKPDNVKWADMGA